jgi:hypothetical protein
MWLGQTRNREILDQQSRTMGDDGSWYAKRQWVRLAAVALIVLVVIGLEALGIASRAIIWPIAIVILAVAWVVADRFGP